MIGFEEAEIWQKWKSNTLYHIFVLKINMKHRNLIYKTWARIHSSQRITQHLCPCISKLCNFSPCKMIFFLQTNLGCQVHFPFDWCYWNLRNLCALLSFTPGIRGCAIRFGPSPDPPGPLWSRVIMLHPLPPPLNTQYLNGIWRWEF